MTLRRQSGGADRFLGGGSIRQTSEGGLEFVLYDTSAVDAFRETFSSHGAGAWLGPDDFWHLTATALDGDVWTAEWVDADLSSTHAHPGAIVRGTFREMSRTSDAPHEGGAFRAYARTTCDIPRNARLSDSRLADRDTTGFSRGIWKIESSICGPIVVTQLSEGIDVDVADCDAELAGRLGIRLKEALTFALSSPIEWIVEETVSSNHALATIREQSRLKGRPRLRPPIEPHRREGMRSCGALLNQYLAYVLAYPPTDTLHHPLTLAVTKTLRASSLVVEDETLALSTEVERLIREHFADRGSPLASLVAAVESAIKHLASWVAPADGKERVLNAIHQMKGPNPRTALRKLVEEGVIRPQHFQSWERVRHVAAHGLPVSSSSRELVAHNDVVHQLFLLLVFHVIGYQGVFHDHTVNGWPAIEVPQSSPSGVEEEPSPADSVVQGTPAAIPTEPGKEC
jgi:hypothetical protein